MVNRYHPVYWPNELNRLSQLFRSELPELIRHELKMATLIVKGMFYKKIWNHPRK